VQRSRRRLTRLRVRVLDESSGEFTFGHVCDVIDKGVQPVYRVTLADGKALTLTENHRVLTSEGWATMRAALGLIGTGSEARLTRPAALIVNGIPAHRNRAWVAAQRRAGKSVTEIAAEARCSYHTVRKWLRVHDLGFSAEERLGRVPRSRGPREAGPRLVPAPSRRAPLCRGGVGAGQGSEPAPARELCPSGAAAAPAAPQPGFTLTADAVRVVAVAFVGLRQTYDLSIAGRWHNFVANGVVVHNSFNEFSMRYAKATDEFYVPEPEDVRSQVGKPGAYTFEPVDAQLAEETREELRAVYEHAFETYERLVEQGVARELARVVIPVGAYTEFYWTLNARSLMNFVSLRAAETAQREIRRYAEACERFLAEKMPVTHAAFVANDRTAP
jgi:thymidylate synthase (FAD)